MNFENKIIIRQKLVNMVLRVGKPIELLFSLKYGEFQKKKAKN